MAVKGSIAKTEVENRIREAFGEDFIGVADKKIYLWADDGGQKIQVALSMTCPKVGLDATAPAAPANTNSFIQGGIVGTYVGQPVVEMTAEEEATIQSLIDRLGL